MYVGQRIRFALHEREEKEHSFILHYYTHIFFLRSGFHPRNFGEGRPKKKKKVTNW